MGPNIRLSFLVDYLYLEKIPINITKNYVRIYAFIERIGYDSLQLSYI